MNKLWPIIGFLMIANTSIMCMDIDDNDDTTRVTTLSFRNHPNQDLVTDITLLSQFPNITSLTLNYCDHIEDFTPISELRFLRTLDLCCVFNGYNDPSLSFLERLIGLRTLDLSSNDYIYDLTPVGHLLNLRWLSLRNSINTMETKQESFQVLGNLPNLEFLDLCTIDGIDNLDFLNRLTNLKELVVWENDDLDLNRVTLERVSFLPQTINVTNS